MNIDVNHLRLGVNRQRVNLRSVDDGLTSLRTVLAANLFDFMSKSPDMHTQTALAKRSGIAQATIGRILRSEVAATVDTLEALATALGVHSYLLLHHNPSFAAKEAEFYTRMRLLISDKH